MNPFCPKHKLLMKSKIMISQRSEIDKKPIAMARFWVCPKGCRYKIGGEVIDRPKGG